MNYSACGYFGRFSGPDELAAYWQSATGIVTPKHDPRNSGSAFTAFRSVIDPMVIENMAEIFPNAAHSGTAVKFNKHPMPSMIFTPTGIKVGYGFPSGSTSATEIHDTIVFAKFDCPDVHIYSENLTRLLARNIRTFLSIWS